MPPIDQIIIIIDYILTTATFAAVGYGLFYIFKPNLRIKKTNLILNLRIKNHILIHTLRINHPTNPKIRDGEPDWICNAPSKGQGQSDGPSSAWINFQDPASTNMESIYIFNYHLLFYMIQIVIFVFWLLSLILSHYQEWVLSNSAHFYEHSELEIAWTVVPCLILLKILDPSLSLLHSCESNYYPK